MADTKDDEQPRDEHEAPAEHDAATGEAAQEWGERIETGKQIARGGKDSGRVPGAEPDRGPKDGGSANADARP